MQWGSQWQVATHGGFNPFCLCGCQSLESSAETNQGGTQFKERRSINPLVRVTRPQQRPEDNTVALNTTSTTTPLPDSEEVTNDEYVYATETFDRRQPVSSRKVDSRWLRRHRSLRVPVLDDRLVVAFQKFLREEEMEFLMLIVAIEEGFEHES